MKKSFQNVRIDCWKHSGGRLGFKQPFICMSASSDAVAVVISALNELSIENPPSRRTLTLKTSREGAFKSIQLRFSPVTDDLRKMLITIEDGRPILEFTKEGLPDVRSALAAWQRGVEDFSLYPRGKKSELGERDRTSGELWFWVTMLP